MAPPLPKAEALDTSVLLWLENKFPVQNPVSGLSEWVFLEGNWENSW